MLKKHTSAMTDSQLATKAAVQLTTEMTRIDWESEARFIMSEVNVFTKLDYNPILMAFFPVSCTKKYHETAESIMKQLTVFSISIQRKIET